MLSEECIDWKKISCSFSLLNRQCDKLEMYLIEYELRTE